MLRDELRAVLRATVVPWSTRRDIDHAVGTIWFPFFEQLYRQTITGGRDVLRVLADMEQVRILPFDVHAEASGDGSVVVEGFPGWTLKQCGLPATGCKHVREGGADDRELPARERDSGFRRRCGPGRERCRGRTRWTRSYCFWPRTKRAGEPNRSGGTAQGRIDAWRVGSSTRILEHAEC